MKITYHILLLTATLATTFACKKEEATPVVVPVQAQTVTNIAADTTTGVNPTTGQPLGTTGKYALYSLRENKVIANTDSASNKWDIGFRGTTIIVNGGPIRSGQGGAYVHTGTFEEVTTVPASATFAQDQSTSALAIPAVSGGGWYNYNSSTNIVTPIPGRVLVIKTGDGKYAKVEILSYYKNAPATPTATSRSRFYTFRYAYQPDGSMKLN
ncbi:HmuY family protein [Fibrella forsythiae]|uniref:HmuY family protein n=1 Tax=Fibrella forsythiae TaxID=2817061 RepID=A0ABS3JPR5_9BACT|nr:HmuY family protein [Fibrella forsythiae]MBO0951994.1 HmuY family protein [Fibrella forsythiae]